MSTIHKTKAVVLRKLDYGDTSVIAHFYTEEFGKVTAIIKGARSRKSKMGSIVDVMNLVEIVFYQKENREVQLITQADLIAHYPKIKQDLNRLKYSSAVHELVSSLIIENEKNTRLFKGILRIQELFEQNKEHPAVLFIKFFLFFIKEIGYELHFESKRLDMADVEAGEPVVFHYELGFMNKAGNEDKLITYEFSSELFNLLFCLSKGEGEGTCSPSDLDKLIAFLEKYLRYHISEFKGLKSLRLY